MVNIYKLLLQTTIKHTITHANLVYAMAYAHIIYINPASPLICNSLIIKSDLYKTFHPCISKRQSSICQCITADSCLNGYSE